MLHACCIQLHNSSFDLLCMLKLGCSLTMTIISTLRGTTARAPEVGILRGWATLRMLLWAVLCLRSRQIKLRCRGLNLNSDPQEGKIFPAVILRLPCFICGVASNIFVSFVVLPRISLHRLGESSHPVRRHMRDYASWHGPDTSNNDTSAIHE